MTGQYTGLDFRRPATGSPGQYTGLHFGVDEGIGPPPVFRGVGISVGISWTRATPTGTGLAIPWAGPNPVATAVRARWAHQPPIAAGVRIAWRGPDQVAGQARIGWSRGTPTGTAVVAPWAGPKRLVTGARIGWSRARPLDIHVRVPWRGPALRPLQLRVPWAQAQGVGIARTIPWGGPSLLVRAWRIPWGYGRGTPWIWVPVPPDPPDSPDPGVEPGNRIGLHFQCPRDGWDGAHIPITFGPFQCFLARPRPRTYFVTNSVNVVRLPDRAPVDVTAISFAIDLDSWCWSTSLTLASASALALIEAPTGDPWTIEAEINGRLWTALIEQSGETTEHGRHSRTASGRSRAAYLSDPYAPARSFEIDEVRTAQQLAGLELDFTDFDLTWDAPDWLVDAGAWYYQDKRPLEAILEIAAAAGAVVQAHPSDDALRVLPRYPVSPWQWSQTAPAATLDRDFLVSQGRSLSRGERYEAVVVAGERYGPVGNIKRAGTAGAIYAPQIVDRLITTEPIAIERARNIIAASGPRSLYPVSLPLFAQGSGLPGLLLPGTLIEMAGTPSWRGLVTSCAVTAERRQKERSWVWVVRQQLGIERHHDFS